jgi:transcriptional regulator with XRE-family HTH domain
MDAKMVAEIEELIAPRGGFYGLFEELGQRIARLRASREWNQDELAALLGVSRWTLSNYEQGTQVPTLRCLLILAHLFHLDLDTLVFGTRGASGVRREPVRVVPARALSLVRFDS